MGDTWESEDNDESEAITITTERMETTQWGEKTLIDGSTVERN